MRHKRALTHWRNTTASAGDPRHRKGRPELDIGPKRCYAPRQVPLHRRPATRTVEAELIKKGVIIPQIEPTDWQSPAFYVGKGTTGVRLVTDYTYLNKFVKRPVHPFPSAKEIKQSIMPESKFFAKLDCVNGYFQMAIDEESSLKTTFLLPTGRYRYLRGPMGLAPTSDEWNRKSNEMIAGCPWAAKIVM